MTRRLNVVECIDNMGVGGTELNAVRSVEHLPSSKYNVTVVALNDTGPVRARYDALGIPVHHLRVGPLYSVTTLLAILKLSRRLREWGADVVHCHDRYTNFVGSLAARLAGVRLILASKRWGETTSAHQLVSRIAFRFAHRVVANGASTARSLSEQDGVAAARVTLIPNFVDDGMFEPPTHEWVAHTRAQLGIPRSAVVGCIVASLRPVKDHPTLFAALPRIREAVPEFVLLVVGDGPARAELEGLARQLGVQESVKFAGVMAQRPSAHHIADVSLLTSRSEGFPNALVEAMAAARPLVGTDVTGIRDVVVPGENGLLVRSGSSDELAAAVVRLLQNSAERKRMGERGLAIAREHYSASVAIKALMTLYDSAVTGHA